MIHMAWHLGLAKIAVNVVHVKNTKSFFSSKKAFPGE